MKNDDEIVRWQSKRQRRFWTWLRIAVFALAAFAVIYLIARAI